VYDLLFFYLMHDLLDNKVGYLCILYVVNTMTRLKENELYTSRVSYEAEFKSWFRLHICGHNVETVSKQIYDLACGLNHQVAMFKGCIVNRVRLHIKDYERTLRTQNSG
jgi:hypothetical protein